MNFVIIANAWSAGRDNPTSKHRIAIELARLGHHILWIEGAGMRTPSLGSGHDRLRMLRRIGAAVRGPRQAETETGHEERIRVLAPLFIPLPRYVWIRRLNGRLCAWGARFWMRRLGWDNAVLINYVPVLAEAMRGWGKAHDRGAGQEAGADDSPGGRRVRAIYHCVDRWDAFAMYDSRMMAAMDRRCCELADLVIASSEDLLERCRRHNASVHLIEHGVDHEHFSKALLPPPRPDDLPAGPVAGFFGLLSEWLDQDLLLRVAQCLPECQIVLIGRADVAIDRLRGVRNIHLLGPRPFERLPAYVAHFEAGMIPFVVNELTRAVNPIKLREMLSAGCPVVSTDLPAVRPYEGKGATVAASSEAFVAAVAAWIRKPASPAARRRISGEVAQETWRAKVQEIVRLIDREHRPSGAQGRGRT